MHYIRTLLSVSDNQQYCTVPFTPFPRHPRGCYGSFKVGVALKVRPTEGLLVPSSLEEADTRSELTLKVKYYNYYHSMQILINQLKILNCEEDTFKIIITAGGVLVALALLIVLLVLLQAFTSEESGVIEEKI